MKWLLHLLFGLVFLRLSSQLQEIETLPTPEKEECDPYTYDAFKLQNGLKVLLKSHCRQKQIIITLDIKVGYSNFDKNIPEMPHLISEIISKTPIEGFDQKSYSDYMLLHDGEYSPHIDHSNTSHRFEIKPEKFVEFLQHFSRPFQTLPPFTEDDIKEKSKKAFDKFNKFIQNINNELLYIIQDKVIRGHLFYNSQRVNEEFVKNISVESINEFFNKYYIANNMTLTVLSYKPANEIKEMIAECFGSIPNRPIEDYFSGQPLFKEGTLGRVYHINSTNYPSFISINWILPIKYDKLADLGIYLKILLESNAKGSLRQLLTKDELINGVCVGTDSSNSLYSLKIELHLTQKGLDQYQRVTQMFFSYLKFIQSEPIHIHLLEEEKKIRKNQYHGNSLVKQTFGVMMNLTRKLHWCPTENINSSEIQFNVNDDEKIKEFMNQFQPENSIVALVSNGELPIGKNSEASEDCKVKYWTEKLNLEKIIDSAIQFSFPLENTVIPDNLKERAPFNPFRSLDISPRPLFPTTLWFSPINYLYESSERISVFLARNDFFMESVENYSMITLLMSFFQKKFRHEFYYYEKSGFAFLIDIRSTGLSFQFMGYNDNLREFALFFLERFSEFVRSYKYKQIFRGSISSYKFNHSYLKLTTVEQVSKYLSKEFLVSPYSEEDINKAFDSIKLGKMMKFMKDFISESYQLRVFVTGGFLEDDVKLFHGDIFKKLNRFIFKFDWEPLKSHQLIIEPKTVERRTYSNDTSPSNVVDFFFQFLITGNDKKNIVFLHLYKKLFLSQFNKCFPKEEEISCAPDLLISTNGHFVGIGFFVESKYFSCEEIEERILKFIEDSLELLRKIFEPDFQKEQLGKWITEISPNYNFGEIIFASVIENVINEYKNQKTERVIYHYKHWNFITEQDIEVTKEQFKKIASKIKLSEFIKFVEEHLQLDGSERRLMVITITGKDDRTLFQRIKDNIFNFLPLLWN